MTVKSAKEPNTRNESLLDKPRLVLHVHPGFRVAGIADPGCDDV
ncbi:hypothetical protein OAK25_02775 [Synechococcus sp. AH-551-P10]|nr:hypothetical protein [Synechococcus sp. AH-551-E11]MDC0257059.1 hypothetical protein [Synechococcus sp. AH-551-P10]